MSDRNYDPAVDPVVQKLLELADLYERGEITLEAYEAGRNAIEAQAVTQSDNSPKDTDPEADDGGA